MDLNVRRYAKQWLKLPECVTDHILYAGTEKGGLSLPRLSLSVPCSRINVKRAVLNSSDENIRAFAVETGLPEEIGNDADHFKIKLPANPKRGAKWRQLEANRWHKLKVAGHKCSNSWLRNENNYFNEGDFITGLKLRTDTHPTRVALARAGNTGGDIACRRYKAALETIGHTILVPYSANVLQ